MMKQMLSNSYLFGANTPYIEALYDAYLANPASVEPNWRDYFDKLANLPGAGSYTGPDVAHYPIITSFAQRAKEGTLQAPSRAAYRPSSSRTSTAHMRAPSSWARNVSAFAVRARAPLGKPSTSWLVR